MITISRTGTNDTCNSQPAAIHELEAGARRPKRRAASANTDWLWLQACLGACFMSYSGIDSLFDYSKGTIPAIGETMYSNGLR